MEMTLQVIETSRLEEELEIARLEEITLQVMETLRLKEMLEIVRLEEKILGE